MEWMREPFEAALLDEIMQNSVETLDAKTVLLTEGAYIKSIPLMLEGSVRVRKTDESGKEIILYHIQPGESCITSGSMYC